MAKTVLNHPVVPGLLSLLGVTLSLLGVTVTWVTFIRDSESRAVWRVNRLMKQATCDTVLDPSSFIPRESVMATLHERSGNIQNFTCLVSGPRGAGKTTLVRQALQNKPGVLVIEVTPGVAVSEAWLAAALLEALKIQHLPAALQKRPLVLTALAKQKPDPLVLLVEVGERCTSKQLQALLLCLKVWGADYGLIQPIVVVSSSQAVFGLTIGSVALRTRLVTVPNMTAAEATELLTTILKKVVKGYTEELGSETCSKVVSQVGTNPLDLSVFADALDGKAKVRAVKQVSVQELATVVEEVCEATGCAYMASLQECMEGVAGPDPAKQQAFKELLAQLQKGPLPLESVLTTCGLSVTPFIQLLQGLHPHPLYVALETRTVHLGWSRSAPIAFPPPKPSV